MPTKYSAFKVKDLHDLFGLSAETVDSLLQPITEVEPGEFLLQTLETHLDLAPATEKEKSELIVVPLLIELRKNNHYGIKHFSGRTFNVEPKHGLKGRCDFLIVKNGRAFEIEAPIINIFEAKNDNLNQWVGQCAAEMYAARLFNRRSGMPIETIHGAVTSGYDWLFLKLEDERLLIDTDRYGMANLPQLLGALQKLVDFYCQEKKL